MKNKRTGIILTLFITFISLGSLSFAQECLITDCIDADKDAYTSDGLPDCNDPSCSSCICGDCNDSNPNSYLGAGEICDGEDNDCNFMLPSDEADEDNDGFMICENDCNDDDPSINSNATEICDYIDNNCDGNTDEDFPDLGETCGIGACAGIFICNLVGTDTECNGNSPATEVCDNNIDDDCDGISDCDDPDCADDPYCTGIPEFSTIFLAPVLIILSITLLRFKHVF